jgi:hypothetical protein
VLTYQLGDPFDRRRAVVAARHELRKFIGAIMCDAQRLPHARI